MARGGQRKHGLGRLRLAALLLAVAVVAGCAAGYAGFMRKTLRRMERRDWAGALKRLDKPVGDTNMLLYRLERGLILHYAGDWAGSDRQFAKAERLVDRLSTRSLGRELAALVTNDAIRAYRGEPFELVLIHYYRALNSHYLADEEGALVEVRKANQILADAAEAAEVKLSYRNDAFMQYLTGMWYESQGEVNDAYISYRDAVKGYAAYEEAFGMRPPPPVAADLLRTTRQLGFEPEWRQVQTAFGLQPMVSPPPAPGRGTITVFAESGFIGRKGQTEIDLPILQSDDTGQVWVVSDRLVYRHHHPGYHQRVQYWLRLALPVYRPGDSRVAAVRLRLGGAAAPGWLLQDLSAIAARTLQEEEDTILLRTAARALAKWVAKEKAEDRSRFLGILVNLFGTGTEAADTRSWISLPQTIWMVRAEIPPGTAPATLEFMNAGGHVIDSHRFEAAELAADRPVFLNWRSFR